MDRVHTVTEMIDAALVQARDRRSFMVASSEGRLDEALARELHLPTGRVRCAVCGMLSWDEEAAAACCRDGEEDLAVEWKRPPSKAVAEVVDREALCRAADAEVVRSGLRSRSGLGMYIGFWLSVERGETRWLTVETWARLLAIFDGDVPGCVEC